MRMYGIRDKKTLELWSNKGRFVWHGTGPAKNAWNLCKYWSRPIDCRFDDQDEYELVEYKLVEVSDE